MRIALPPSRAIWNHNAKFGVSLANLPNLLQVARELHLKVDGVAYHVGTPSLDASAHANAVRAAKRVFEVSQRSIADSCTGMVQYIDNALMRYV